MCKLAGTVCIALGLAISACSAPPEMSHALSEPDPALFDQRMAGAWYSVAWEFSPLYLSISPREDGSSFDVVLQYATQAEGQPQPYWQRFVAYASRIDGVTYYNMKRVAAARIETEESKAGDDAKEDRAGYLIMKAEFVGDSAFFLRVMEPAPVAVFAETRQITAYRGQAGLFSSPFHLFEIPHDDLVALIHRIRAKDLFWVFPRPFYRLGSDPRALGQPTATDPATEDGKFGQWQVDCDIDPRSSEKRPCLVHDTGRNITIRPTGQIGIWRVGNPYDTIEIEDHSCKDFAIKVDGMAPIDSHGELIEAMHFGRALNIEYTGCPGERTKHVAVSLRGFAAAFAGALNSTLTNPAGVAEDE